MTIMLRILAACAVIALGTATLVLGASVQPASEPTRPNAAPDSYEIVPLENVAASAGSSLLARAPFAADRGAFTRTPVVEPAETPRDVRLVGISSVDGRLRATLLIDGQQLVVTEGDPTPLGEVTELTITTIEFGREPPSVLRLFPN